MRLKSRVQKAEHQLLEDWLQEYRAWLKSLSPGQFQQWIDSILLRLAQIGLAPDQLQGASFLELAEDEMEEAYQAILRMSSEDRETAARLWLESVQENGGPRWVSGAG